MSDFRSRKINEVDNQLKNFLVTTNVQIVYSKITLNEINQIPLDKYKFEHIEVLEELNAKYIEPVNKKLINKKPIQIWNDYINNLNYENDPLKTKELALNIDKLSRKGAGLPIKDSFEEIGVELEKHIQFLSKTIIDSINSLDINFNENNLKEEFKGNAKQIQEIIKQMKKNLPILLNDNIQNSNKLARLDNLPLGTKPFREYSPIKKLNISKLPSSEVVFVIENILNDNTFKDLTNNFYNSKESKISRAYSLMNWAGYYPDDFEKIKKNQDRFRASNNDMQHATFASNTTFLISNDNAFCKKAIASYEYAGVDTIVCSSETFLEKYLKFKNASGK